MEIKGKCTEIGGGISVKENDSRRIYYALSAVWKNQRRFWYTTLRELVSLKKIYMYTVYTYECNI